MPQSDENGKEDFPESPQALVGIMSNDEWDQLLDYVNAMVGEIERLPLPGIKDQVFELLAGIMRADPDPTIEPAPRWYPRPAPPGPDQ